MSRVALLVPSSRPPERDQGLLTTLAIPSGVAGTMPFSVMIPVTRSAGVTSKAGFRALLL